MEQISDESKILELGCGVGIDAVAFADAGHDEISTYFS
jgi:ubiquinone/menaquinone biosynthesis C-methylase UbiE